MRNVSTGFPLDGPCLIKYQGRVVHWLLAALTVFASASAVAVSPVERFALAAIGVWLTVTAAVGVLLAGWVRSNPIGWLLLVLASAVATSLAARAYAVNRVAAGAADAALVPLATWLAKWVAVPGFAMIAFVLLVFPTGRLPSPRWRPLAWVTAAALTGGSGALAFQPGVVEGVGLDNPFGWTGHGPLLQALTDVLMPVVALTGLGALGSVVVRYRRSSGDERQQLGWLAFATVVFVACGIFAFAAEGALNDLSFVAALVGLTGVPVAIGVAVLRYRLYDLGTIVNRTLVYGALSIGVTALYIGTVVGIGTALDRAAGLAASLLATALVAFGFQPLRQRIQHAVDRAMYGERRDPYSVLTGLTRRLRATPDPTGVPELVVTTLTDTLGLAYAAIELDHPDGAVRVAERGDPGTDVAEVPLSYQDEVVGRLLHARPRGGTAGRTEQLLGDLADQVTPALQAARLTSALQLSRERLVLAREEERRQLRGDLHDSLGPDLAGLTMGIEAVENLLATDPAAAAATLELLRERARGTVSTVRAVVDGLRPPALDDLGLAEAVHQRTAALRTGSGPGVDVRTEGDLLRLPAAVEVAAYHVAVEAATNAVRHASARHVSVVIARIRNGLLVRVDDDGRGLPVGIRAGAYGLVSMRERAAELGGSFDLQTGATGTTITVVLPLPASAA